MRQGLRSVKETAELISAGHRLLLAGDEAALRGLPAGNWVGGTIPYFMAGGEGGLSTRERIFVSELPDCAEGAQVRTYDVAELRNVYRDAPDNGLSVIILPAATAVHQAFATEAPTYAGFGTRPLVGWIAGVHLDDLGKAAPKVFAGNGEPVGDKAVVLHLSLPRTKAVDIGILNIFEPGQGDSIVFADTGFVVRDALINGEKRNLAAYIRDNKLDTKLPFVADYYGASINVSVQSVDHEKGEVTLYAPVFSGVTYKHAQPVGDYVSEFTKRLPRALNGDLLFSCNCILNYLYSGLEGRSTGNVVGPITFGEIAYQLLNQTLAYVTLIDLEP